MKRKVKILIIAHFLLFYFCANVSGQVSSTYYGTNAGSNSTAGYNSFFGYNAGNLNSTGTLNVFHGSNSGINNTTGNANVFIGHQSGYSNNTGIANVAIGYKSLFISESYNANIAIGGYSMESLATGASNTSIGYCSLRNLNNGAKNVAVGQIAGSSLITGDLNTLLGFGAGFNNINGSRNVFIGHRAGGDELGSDKFYVATTTTDTRLLLYGDFVTKQLAIGTKNIPTNIQTSQGESYALFVPRGILTDEVKVKTGWADYVFEKSFELPSIEEEIAFISENGHLMSFPSAKEIEEDGGINVGEMMVVQQEMIEKLMLYVAELKGEIEGMKK